MVIVASLPMTCAAIIVTDSATTGFTLPGMMLLPGCSAGNAISPKPANGPLFIHIANFSRGEGGGALGNVPAVIDAAFSQDVLDGRLSPIVEVEKGRGVVLRATDHKLPQQKPLDAVRAELVAAWKKQRGVELAAAAAADAVKRLSAGDGRDAVAKSLGAALQPAKFVARTDQA